MTKLGAGPSLVMLHGWGMHSGIWQALAQQLAQRFTVYLVDLPGHGNSEWQKGDLALSVFLARLIEHIPERSIIVGWSLGGTLALALADRYPSYVASLVLMAATPCFTKQKNWENAIDKGVFERFNEQLKHNFSKTIRQFLLLQVQEDPDRKALTRLINQQLAVEKAPNIDALVEGLALLRDIDLREELATLACPVRLILGQNDLLVPVQMADDTKRIQSNVTLTIIEQSGHVPFILYPKQCQQAIIESAQVFYDVG